MNHYILENQDIDSIDLKCLLVSRGIKVAGEVYKAYSKTSRLGINPLMCNTMLLSDGTIVQLTDVGFHLEYLSGILSFENLKLLKYASSLGTDFSLKLTAEGPGLFYKEQFLDIVSFPKKTDFYSRKTTSATPFIGNAVLQGTDWVAFQCLWTCEYAAAGKACEFCFSGGETEGLVKKKKELKEPLSSSDAAEIIEYAIKEVGCTSIQLTGGSTINPQKEYNSIMVYIQALGDRIGIENIPCELLLYITPPKELQMIDDYFAYGVTRIGCSLEIWDEELAKRVTPGKYFITSRERHLKALTYIADKYGPRKAFSNFIIGIEPFESLKAGAIYLAERGIMPTASIWMPMGRPVNGSMKAPDLSFYQRVKELFSELYVKYNLQPPKCRGLNVCMEKELWEYGISHKA